LLRGTIGAIHPNRAPLGSFEIAAEPPSRRADGAGDAGRGAGHSPRRRTRPGAELDGVKYSDYRMVDGVRMPFRIETGQEVWTVQQAEINIALPDKLFRR
jgi:hypothetical protein